MIPVPQSTPVIQWCGICNSAPADGVLKIIRTGEYVPEDIGACNKCVGEIPDERWIGDVP